jgi:hypothetical protein
MLNSWNFKRITALLMVLLVVTIPLAAQSPENDQLFKNIPAETLFCLRINNFNNSLTQMDQFLAGVSPVGLSALVQSQLTSVLGSPQLAGLNMNGSFAAFGAVLSSPNSQAGAMPNIFIGGLAPVSDYKQFINGISSKTPADANGVVKVLSLGNPVILVTQCNNYALFTEANGYDNLLAYKKMMGIGTSASAVAAPFGSVLDSSEANLAANQPIWIYGNVQQAAKSFEPMVTSAINSMKAAMGSAQNTNTGINPASIQNIINMYVSIIDTMMKEVKSVSLSINPTQNSLNITNTVASVSGTEIAKMFATNLAVKENTLLPYLEDGSLMNVAFAMNAPLMKEAVGFQVNLLSLMGGQNVNQENMQKLKALAENMINSVSGPAAYTFSVTDGTKPPFKGKYIIAVKDEKKFRQLMNDSCEMMKTMGIMDIYKSMGIDSGFTFKQNVETYKGIQIDSAKLTFKVTDTNSAQTQMINSMYGDGFDYRWGLVNGLFACTIGPDSDKTLHELIDKIQAGQAKQLCSETKAAVSLVPGAEKSDFFFTMNLIRAIKLVTNYAGAIAPLPIPAVDVPTKSNLVVTGKTENGSLIVNIVLPKDHVQEIMTAVTAMIQKMSQPQQPAPGI